MKIIKNVIAVMVLLGVTGVSLPTPKEAQANFEGEPQVIASSNVVRFEVQPTGYDSATNKFKYKFSWLMPKYRTYSFMIDGKMYNSRVTRNGVVETPFWFSPDVTYSIQVFPYANGRGNKLAEGYFTTPTIAVKMPPEPEKTIEDEYGILIEYLANAPELPTKKVASKLDVAAILLMIEQTRGKVTTSDMMSFLSTKSIELIAQTPLIFENIDTESVGQPDDTDAVLKGKITILKGKEYAILKYKSKNQNTGKLENVELVFVKENGKWKVDLVQTFKIAFENELD